MTKIFVIYEYKIMEQMFVIKKHKIYTYSSPINVKKMRKIFVMDT
jgi:predicted AAA+ superfamily ATPase